MSEREQLDNLKAENERLKWKLERMESYLQGEVRHYEYQQQEYQGGGDEIMAALYKGMKEVAQDALRTLTGLHVAHKPEGGGNG